MKPKNIQIISLSLLFLTQLFVLGSMVWQHENVATQGERLKFRIQPIDPNDPFRGKYITLNFMNNSTNTIDWKSEQSVDGKAYIRFEVGPDGFARIAGIQNHASEKEPYLELPAESIRGRYGKGIHVDFPFNRFYMEESKAPQAEKELRRNLDGEDLEAYALVAMKDGKAILLDVYVNEISIKDFLGK